LAVCELLLDHSLACHTVGETLSYVCCQEHHKYQGDDELDMDIPSRLEGRLFYNTFTKLLWVILQPFFYTLRPVLMRPKPITCLEVINFTIQVAAICISFSGIFSNT